MRTLPLLVVVLVAACGNAKPIESLSAFAEHGATTSQRNPSPFDITAVAQEGEGGELLAMTLRNISDGPVTLSDASMPWVYQNLDVAAIATDGRVVVNSYPIIDTWPTKEVTLLPGQSVSGSYTLRNGLNLTPKDRASDLIILWSYLPVEEGKVFDKITGVALLPKKQQ